MSITIQRELLKVSKGKPDVTGGDEKNTNREGAIVNVLGSELVEGVRYGRRDKVDFLYVGDHAEYFARSPCLPTLAQRGCYPRGPRSRFLYSTASTVLNAVPCVALDGARTTRDIVNTETHATVEFRAATVAALTLAGTLMLATNLLLEVRKLL